MYSIIWLIGPQNVFYNLASYREAMKNRHVCFDKKRLLFARIVKQPEAMT